MKKVFRIRKLLLFLLIAMVAILVFGLIVLGLWNAILPELLNAKPINLGQAIGLLVLTRILFGGLSHGYGGGWGGRRRAGWKQHMQEKWSRMTPEEREQFQQNWKSRCYPWKKPGGDMANKE